MKVKTFSFSLGKYRFATDLDGCLTTGVNEQFLDKVNKLKGTKLSLDNLDQYYVENIVDISEDEKDRILHELDYANVGVMPYAREALRRISEMYDIDIVTARNLEDSKVCRQTIDWLVNNSIPCSRLIFTKNKIKIARMLKYKYFVEDYGEMAMRLAQDGIVTYLIDYRHNKNAEHDNIIRVGRVDRGLAWLEIYADFENRELK